MPKDKVSRFCDKKNTLLLLLFSLPLPKTLEVSSEGGVSRTWQYLLISLFGTIASKVTLPQITTLIPTQS